MLEGMETTGVYRVEEDRLYMADQEIDESRYDNFHFEEDKLIIELPAEADPQHLYISFSLSAFLFLPTLCCIRSYPRRLPF